MGKEKLSWKEKKEDIYENKLLEENSSKCQARFAIFFLMLFLFCGDKYQYLGECDVCAELVRLNTIDACYLCFYQHGGGVIIVLKPVF